MNKDLVAECFAANLARYKRERGLSLEELSRRTQIHRTHLGVLLRGERLVRIDTVVKLAGALEVHPGALLEGVVWQVPPAAEEAGGFAPARGD